ncbi:MAG TPA: PmoA family protein [Lacipirellulaceae bacterium]|nr:PmoA family protein [Lacipirellulaceae bacterium]
MPKESPTIDNRAANVTSPTRKRRTSSLTRRVCGSLTAQSLDKTRWAISIKNDSLNFLLRCALGVAAIPVLAVLARADVTATPSERGVVIKIDGKPFTEYRKRAGHAPAMYPVIGPTGKGMTRGYPFTPPAKDGTHDHPHHQSLWFTHDKVNGANFWRADLNDDKDDSGPHIAHREFVAVQGGRDRAHVVARDDWMNGAKRVCSDERTVVYGVGPGDNRWIDFTITLKASDGDVKFGDTKEGSFAVRVADSMRVDAKKGGHIVNSEDQENAAAWGMPARWVDYTGPVDGETIGITMMSHPKSFRPVPRFHVRTYGLFAVNPFGEKDFPKLESYKQGAVTIKSGDSLTLRYRVVLHRGGTDKGAIEAEFKKFSAE